MGECLIIKCDESHLDALADFYDKITEYLDRTINYPLWTPHVYPGRESIAKAISEKVQYACFKDGIIVGAFVFNDDPQGNYSKGDWEKNLADGEYKVIHTLAVSTDMSRKGIGRRMVNYCIDLAKEEGYKGIRLDVVPTNIPAKKLYENSGFKFAGEKDLERGFENIPTFSLYEFNF